MNDIVVLLSFMLLSMIKMKYTSKAVCARFCCVFVLRHNLMLFIDMFPASTSPSFFFFNPPCFFVYTLSPLSLAIIQFTPRGQFENYEIHSSICFFYPKSAHFSLHLRSMEKMEREKKISWMLSRKIISFIVGWARRASCELSNWVIVEWLLGAWDEIQLTPTSEFRAERAFVQHQQTARIFFSFFLTISRSFRNGKFVEKREKKQLKNTFVTETFYIGARESSLWLRQHVFSWVWKMSGSMHNSSKSFLAHAHIQLPAEWHTIFPSNLISCYSCLLSLFSLLWQKSEERSGGSGCVSISTRMTFRHNLKV